MKQSVDKTISKVCFVSPPPLCHSPPTQVNGVLKQVSDVERKQRRRSDPAGAAATDTPSHSSLLSGHPEHLGSSLLELRRERVADLQAIDDCAADGGGGGLYRPQTQTPTSQAGASSTAATSSTAKPRFTTPGKPMRVPSPKGHISSVRKGQKSPVPPISLTDLRAKYVKDDCLCVVLCHNNIRRCTPPSFLPPQIAASRRPAHLPRGALRRGSLVQQSIVVAAEAAQAAVAACSDDSSPQLSCHSCRSATRLHVRRAASAQFVNPPPPSPSLTFGRLASQKKNEATKKKVTAHLHTNALKPLPPLHLPPSTPLLHVYSICAFLSFSLSLSLSSPCVTHPQYPPPPPPPPHFAARPCPCCRGATRPLPPLPPTHTLPHPTQHSIYKEYNKKASPTPPPVKHRTKSIYLPPPPPTMQPPLVSCLDHLYDPSPLTPPPPCVASLLVCRFPLLLHCLTLCFFSLFAQI